MATISGRLLFDRDRVNNPAAPNVSGIANVPVILQNTSTLAAVASLTDTSGNYSFINVPVGNYRIVEVYGAAGAVLPPADFNEAVVESIPAAAVPPLSFVSNSPTEATNLDCVTPNTILVTITDNSENITVQAILNGPVLYTPIETLMDECADIIDGNLIIAADGGKFGFFEPGTPANTAPTTPPVEPFPGLVPDFEYVLSSSTFPPPSPDDGEYVIQNIMNDNYNNFGHAPGGTWHRIADRTTGNETGIFMLVNGYDIDSVFFTTAVSVNSKSHYLFSAWILNVYKFRGPFLPPALGVRITGNNTGLLYEGSLGVEIPLRATVPEWKQIGTDIFTRSNTSITINFVSEGEAGFGNDYAV
ncbi:MAG: carboxypeptidase-like regulatory domain-containing protein, partial [Oscillospiraceae bacterium]|nr:carboxypeptidase-like regulatory domain-containing protein [Oscillospiraceae bacterium]